MDPTGLGNLIIGYDEDPAQGSPNKPIQTGDRSGSHNLIIGRYHRFTGTAFGGLVAGEQNTISYWVASVTGGAGNIASGPYASVTGGAHNAASAELASITGGTSNTASGGYSVILGGQ